ncbi:hypothetical protein FRC12_002188, partial [Ceratobasidium sp. 428]
MIKPIGVYGCKSEIIKFFRGIDCFGEETEALLSDTTSSTSGLRSGLYVVLPLNDDVQDSSTHSAYIVYWPEDTTWEDQAISSVCRNRVTFMRYLSKLTDQTVALVSTQQAEAIVWQAGACNKDAPMGATDISNDLRMNFFEVAMFDQSEEDVIASLGFTVYPDPHDIPQTNDTLRVELVSGEEKAGLMVSTLEPPRRSQLPFKRTMNPMVLRSMIESREVPCVIGSEIAPEQLLILGKHGLRTVYSKEFAEYEERMSAGERARDFELQEDTRNIESRIRADKPRLKVFITRTIQALFQKYYPYVYGEAAQEIHSAEDALLCEQYPKLKDLSNTIESEYKLTVIEDNAFKNLKQAWYITRNFFSCDPTPSASDQQSFIDEVLAGPYQKSRKEKGEAKSKVTRFFQRLRSRIPEGLTKHYWTQSLNDREFAAALGPFLHIFPTVSELTGRITNSVEAYHATLAGSILKRFMSSIVKQEQDRQLNISRQRRDEQARLESHTALLTLREKLKAAMPHGISQATRIDSIKLARFVWNEEFS